MLLPLLAFVFGSLIIAAALGLLIAVATTSLPYLVSSPTTDPHFGALNHCLTGALHGPRLGWAVAPDASRAAVYGPQAVAVCGRGGASVRLEVAGAQLTYEVAKAYALDRSAFGKPVGKFQVWRHRFADMATRIEAGRALTYNALRLYVAGENPIREVSMAKMYTSEVAVHVGRDDVPRPRVLRDGDERREPCKRNPP